MSEMETKPKRPWRRKLFLWSVLILVIVAAFYSRHWWLPSFEESVKHYLPGQQAHKIIEEKPIKPILVKPIRTVPISSNNVIQPKQDQYQHQIQQLMRQDRRLQLQINALQLQLQIKNTHGIQWHLADAHYLLRMANDQLTINNNPDTAIVLLQDANQQLAMVSQPQYAVLRSEIIKTIAQLKRLPKIDINEMTMRIAKISDQIQSLPSVAPMPAQHLQQQQVEQQDWRQIWHKTLQELRSLVVITKTEQSMKPLLTCDQRIYFNLHASNLLQQAQWAVLHRNQKIYQSSIKQTIQLINQYFKNDPQTVIITQQLKNLLTVNVAPEYPDIQGLMQQLKDLTDKPQPIIKPKTTMRMRQK